MRGTRTTAFLFIAGLLLLTGALVAVGCGSGGTAKGGNEVGPGLSPFVGITAGEMVGPASRKGPGYGFADFTRFDGWEGHYEVKASDARAGGTLELTVMEADVYPDGHAAWRGRWVLTNSEGTWVCDQFTGAHDSGENQYASIEALGTGGYQGLMLHEQWHFSSAASSMTPPSGGFTVSGWIEKAK